MLILLLNGSPKKNGITATLLTEALQIATQHGVKTKLIQVSEVLSDQRYLFCRQCSTPCSGNCARHTKLGESFDLLRQADGMILGSPVYFGTVTAQLKAFWDKSRQLRQEKALLNVVGGAIAVGSSRFGGQENTIRAMHEMMLVQGMTIVGDGHSLYDCGHHGACAQSQTIDKSDSLLRMRVLMLRLLEVAEVTRSLRKHHY